MKKLSKSLNLWKVTKKLLLERNIIPLRWKAYIIEEFLHQ